MLIPNRNAVFGQIHVHRKVMWYGILLIMYQRVSNENVWESQTGNNGLFSESYKNLTIGNMIEFLFLNTNSLCMLECQKTMNSDLILDLFFLPFYWEVWQVFYLLFFILLFCFKITLNNIQFITHYNNYHIICKVFSVFKNVKSHIFGLAFSSFNNFYSDFGHVQIIHHNFLIRW